MKSITCQVSENINNNLKLRLANNLMKCESLGITSGTLKHQYSHGMNLNKLVNLTAKVNFRRKFRVDLLPFLNQGSLSPSAQHRVVYRKIGRRFPVVLQEIRK